MLVRNLSIQSGLPTELWGLLDFNFYNKQMFVSGSSDFGFSDACKVGSSAPNSDGVYLVAGSGLDSGSTPVTSVLILANGVPVDYVVVQYTGLVGSSFVACEALPVTSEPETDVAWFLASDEGRALRLSGISNAVYANSYAFNGAVMPSGTIPLSGKGGLAASVLSEAIVAYGATSTTGQEFMSKKSVADATTTAWTAVSVPGTSSGYSKARQSRDGWVIAVAGGDGLHISTAASGSWSMLKDTTYPLAADIDYSANDDLFISFDSTRGVVFTAPAGWSSSGPPTWTEHNPPTGVGDVIVQVVAMDVVSAYAHGSSSVPSTWYLIVTNNVANDRAVAYVTQDFTTYHSVSVPGIAMSHYYTKTKLKFVHDRLFVFTKMGFSVSGVLGRLVTAY